MDSKILVVAAAGCALLFAAAVPVGGTAGRDSALGPLQESLSAECEPNASDTCTAERLRAGRKLFDVETFGGNGRTCRTCHSKQTGTFSPEDAVNRLVADATDPLFLHDGLDDGFSGTSRITEHATVRIEIPLPPDVVLADEPGRRSVTLNRGTPTTMNTPALDRLLMYDTREPTLQRQAFNAIHGHAQNTREPTPLELDLIQEFQQKDSRFFSSEALMAFANGGSAPQLPEGTTESERRGRAMFDSVRFDPVTATTSRGICNMCHAGPMLNQFAPLNPVGPPGGRRADIGVSLRNVPGNPVYRFLVTNPDGIVVAVTSPDPGVMLLPTLPLPPPGSGVPQPPRAFFADVFKIPTLWGVARTAPYFHDNSAKTLEDVAKHYAIYFATGVVRFNFTQQDESDMVAFLKLLR